jgi:hypothetical protein
VPRTSVVDHQTTPVESLVEPKSNHATTTINASALNLRPPPDLNPRRHHTRKGALESRPDSFGHPEPHKATRPRTWSMPLCHAHYRAPTGGKRWRLPLELALPCTAPTSRTASSCCTPLHTATATTIGCTVRALPTQPHRRTPAPPVGGCHPGVWAPLHAATRGSPPPLETEHVATASRAGGSSSKEGEQGRANGWRC